MLSRMIDGQIVEVSPITKDCMVLSYLPDWAHGNVDNIGVANNDGGVRNSAELAAHPGKGYHCAGPAVRDGTLFAENHSGREDGSDSRLRDLQ